MKRKRRILFTVLILLSAISSFVVLGCSGKTESTFEFSESKVWLDRYEEMEIELSKGDIDGIEFVSEDETVITVRNNKLIAEGVGKSSVTATRGKESKVLEVNVSDSGTLPRIYYNEGEGIQTYKDVNVPANVSLRYNGEVSISDATYDTVIIEDSSFAVFENGHIKGLAVGETYADVSVEYKGLSLSLENVKVVVKEAYYIETAAKNVEIYNINSGKNKEFKLNSAVYYCGEILENAQVEYKIISGKNCVRIENSTVYAVEEGEAEIAAFYNKDDINVEQIISVTVRPNYIETDFVNLGLTASVYEEYSESVDGRTGVKRYRPGSDLEYVNGSYKNLFNHRIAILNDGGEKLMTIVKNGYKYFAFDVYYTSEQQTYIGCYNITSWLSVNSYFRKNYFSILNSQGEVINYLPNNEWVTFVYDLRAFFDYSFSMQYSFWFVNTDKTKDTFITDVRWYLDDAFIKSENLSYEKKDSYIQATNDEFDVRYPYLEKTAVYEKDDAEIEGVVNSYKYTANENNIYNNSLVLATSMNETYDEGFYELRKKGSFVTYDVFIETGETVMFQMFDNKDTAKNRQAVINLGETSLSPYSEWLTVIKDGKLCMTMEKGCWYTVKISYYENYDDSCWSSHILFSLGNAGDTARLNNVRYLKEDIEIKEYNKEKYYPFGRGDVDVVWITEESEFRFDYKVTNRKDGDKNNSVNFNMILSENGTAGDYFKGGYRYLRTEIYIESGTTAIIYGVTGTGLTEREYRIELGKSLPGNVVIRTLDDMTAEVMNAKKWYVLYIPVEVTGVVTNPNVYLTTSGGSTGNPSIMFLSKAECVSEINAPFAKSSFNSVIKYQSEGDFKGRYKFTSNAGGDVTGGDYGDSGVFFNGISSYYNGKPVAGRFFEDGYTYVSLSVYLCSDVQNISVRSNGPGLTGYWKKKVKIGDAVTSDLHIYYSNGVKASVLERNVWYQVFIPVSYSEISAVEYPYVCIYTSENTATQSSSFYFNDIKFVNRLPDKPYVSLSSRPQAQTSTLNYVTSGDFDACWEHTETLQGDLGISAGGGDYGFNGLFFSGVEKNGNFFEKGYKCIRFKCYFAENAESFSLRSTGTGITNYWKQKVMIKTSASTGTALGNDFYIYDLNGNKASAVELGKWYTISIPVSYDDASSAASAPIICFYLNGGTSEKPAKIYIKDLEYLTSTDL